MKNLYATAFAALATAAMAQTPQFEWGKQFAGQGWELGTLIAVDNAGNSHNVVIFDATTDFDPGTGSNTITAKGGFDFAVTKLSPAGTALWTSHIGGLMDEYANAITVDASGNVYLVGTFMDTVDFDPGPGTFTLYTATESVFVLKLTSSGSLSWAKQFEGTGFDSGKGIGVDASGNVITTGYFDGTTDFNPGAGTFTATATAFGDMFVSKLDNSGNFVYAQIVTSQDYIDPSSLTLNSSGDIFITGQFFDATDFDPSSSTAVLSPTINSAFVLKLANNGTFQFVKEIGGEPTEIKTDGSGSIVVSGVFTGTIDIDPGTSVNVLSATQYDYFLLKLTAAGNFSWAHQSGTPDNAYLYSIAIDQSNNIYATGSFDGDLDLDPGTSTYSFQANGVDDIFLARYSSAGAFSWGGVVAGSDYESTVDIVVDGTGNVYAGGYHMSTDIDLDPGTGTFTLTTSNSFFDIEAFVLKLSVCDLMADTGNVSSLCGSGAVTLSATSTGTISWYSSATGGSPLATGAAYTSPSLGPGSYTYYISSSSCGTTTPRTALTVTVNAVPQVTASASQTLICPGSAVTLAMTGASTYSVDGVAISGSSYTVSPTVTTAYTLTGANGDCEGAPHTLTITVSNCTSVDDLSSVQAVLYPNPATEYFVADGGKDGCSLTISNIQGMVIRTQHLAPGENMISCDGMARGMYIVTTFAHGHRSHARLVVE